LRLLKTGFRGIAGMESGGGAAIWHIWHIWQTDPADLAGAAAATGAETEAHYSSAGMPILGARSDRQSADIEM
jgi:hypothetical protein